MQTVRKVVEEHPDAFDEILWVLFDERTKLLYDGAMMELDFNIAAQKICAMLCHDADFFRYKEGADMRMSTFQGRT